MYAEIRLKSLLALLSCCSCSARIRAAMGTLNCGAKRIGITVNTLSVMTVGK